ncbi:hypothetical protein [Streptomyces spectabilis]|uniref:Uncharacterized protein n=1 Tax=Streptomyces spectabilis TaxID=68270 RepID=A0A7W8EYQ9_STRST|nr:hypothetical protein [Streptomyces spectabilis]MBB5109166.1 hypothetical protein [Streptomyces spectabilis]MCI3907726.1 hypothetical protein [Streptomyces spectabilis]GGV51175.1 hypothetical protein GCM10010245_80570 [Streptomyces spectabilis]
MEAIPIALDGYLAADAEPGTREGTASWRLTCSAGTDHLIEEAVIPCTTVEPELAHALLTERQPGDLLRVTGHLTLPDTADGAIRLHAEALEVLWEAPLLNPDSEATGTTTTTTDPDADRHSAIAALAEALTGLAQSEPGPGQSIRLHISPTGVLGTGLEHCHSFNLTPDQARQLADRIDALNCCPRSEHPDGGIALAPETLADLTALFAGIDLIDLTNAVLKATRPERRPAAIHAMDDMFGNHPDPDGTDP